MAASSTACGAPRPGRHSSQVAHRFPWAIFSAKIISVVRSMDDRKIQYSCLAGLAFVILSSPQVYQFTNSIAAMFGGSTCNSAGCPNVYGLLTHGAVVGLIIFALLSNTYLISIAQPPMM